MMVGRGNYPKLAKLVRLLNCYHLSRYLTMIDMNIDIVPRDLSTSVSDGEDVIGTANPTGTEWGYYTSWAVFQGFMIRAQPEGEIGHSTSMWWFLKSRGSSSHHGHRLDDLGSFRFRVRARCFGES